jgi:hypothetical protein
MGTRPGPDSGGVKDVDIRRSLLPAMAVAFAVASAASALGVPARATYGARTTADEPQYLLSALSLAEDGDLDISDELAARRWRPFHEAALPEQTRPLAGGRRISPHDPLLPVLLAPAVAIGGWIGAKLTLVLLAGVTAALLVWTAVRRLGVTARVAALVVAVLSASVPLAPYGSQVYPELPAALVVTAGLGALLAPLRRAGVVTVVAACCALPWLGIKYAPVAMVLATVAVVRLVRDRRVAVAGALVAALAVAGAVYLVVHQVVWTGWTVYASADHFVGSGEAGVIGFAPNYWGRSVRLAGLLTERSFGIAAWQPAWLLAVPALAAMMRARPASWPVLGLVLAVGWLNATFVALTMAGWWFPGRQIVVVLPAGVLAIAWWLDRHRWARRLFAVAGGVGIISWVVLTVEAATGRLTLIFDFFATANPLYGAWRLVLPDFLEVTRTTWWWHAVWLVLLTALAALGWSSVHPRTSGRRGSLSS